MKMQKYNKENILAIIPARGGSKRLPRKNILPLQDKPLVCYSIEAGQNCTLIDKVVVTTDDPAIKQIALSVGADVVDRPAYLAADDIRNDQVVMQLIEEYQLNGFEFETVVLLQPTSPLRNGQHLTECLRQFNNGNWKSAMSVCETEYHPGKAVLIQDNNITPFVDDYAMEEQMQKLPKVYRQNGAIYVVKIKDFLLDQKFYQRPCMPYIMSRETSIDIDSALDLEVTTMLMQKNILSELHD